MFLKLRDIEFQKTDMNVTWNATKKKDHCENDKNNSLDLYKLYFKARVKRG